MAVWYTARTTGWQPRMSWRAKAVVAAGVLAVLLVAAMPVALFAGVIMMLLGHVVAGLVLCGASALAATTAVAAVTIAGMSGLRHLRKLVSDGGHRVVQLRRGDYFYS